MGRIARARPISGSYRNRLRREAVAPAPEPPPPPPPDYIVTGTLTPDVTGDYNEAGVYNDAAYYSNATENWFIWDYRPAGGLEGLWVITQTVASLTGPFWSIQVRNPGDPTGTYTAHAPANGTAYVAAP